MVLSMRMINNDNVAAYRRQLLYANNDSSLFDLSELYLLNETYESSSSLLSGHFLMLAVVLCDVLGFICLILNIFVITALLRNRRHMLANVFYVIVLHCAIVDIIRGLCLIVWGMPHLLMAAMPDMWQRLLALKLNQFSLLILRSCNLLTIFNLLVFTINEFIVIRHPLHYRRYFQRRTVLLILFASWIISLLFGVGPIFSYHFNDANHGYTNYNITTDDTSSVTQRELTGFSLFFSAIKINTLSLSMLIIFILCYACLFIVLICYGIILRTIRRFHSIEYSGKFDSSVNSQRINQRQRREQFVIEDHQPKPTINTLLSLIPVLTIGGNRYNSNLRWRMHLMSRHKYLIVIGSVLFVDILFLFPYSAIQLVAILHLNNLLSSESILFRWTLQIIIGIHSVCQPLCYFRMNEFRQLACCCSKGGGSNRRNNAKSQLFNQQHKSYAQTNNHNLIKRDKSDEPHQPTDALLPDHDDDEDEKIDLQSRVNLHRNSAQWQQQQPTSTITAQCSSTETSTSVICSPRQFRTYNNDIRQNNNKSTNQSIDPTRAVPIRSSTTYFL